MPKKPEFHQSMLGLLSKCGQAAYYRYVEGRRAPPGVAAVTGKGTHRGAHANLLSLKDTGEPIEEEAVRAAAAEGFDVAWELDPPLLTSEERFRAKKVRGEAKDQAVVLAVVHQTRVAPRIGRPVHLEHKIVLELPEAPFNLGGTLDIVEALPEGLGVRDTKTSGKRPKAGSAARSVQLELYGWMYEQAHGKTIQQVALDTLVKAKLPYAEPDEAPMPTDHTALTLRLQAAAKVFETGAFMPVDPTGPDAWICSPDWCGYWGICPYGARARSQV